MNWLQDLLTNPNSIAHIVALYAFVIAAAKRKMVRRIIFKSGLEGVKGSWIME